VSGIVIVTATSTVGWLFGKVLESGSHAKSAGEESELSKAEKRR
jgi:hypothetical protein